MKKDRLHLSKEIKGTESGRLKGKAIVLAVCGSVAVVKSFELCRHLMRKGAEVKVVMSDAALKMISADMMEYASGNEVITKLSGKVEHVSLFGANGKADLLLVAPATSNTISKIAMGIDDTPVTTMAVTAIGSRKPIIIAPAMHYSMYQHPIVRANLAKLAAKGFIKIVQPMIEEDKAKFAGIEQACLEAEKALIRHSLEGKKLLVVSGRSHEEIDATRIITNKATGKTGIEIAKEAFRRGAEVCLVHNEIMGLPFPEIKAESYESFFEKTMDELGKGYDILICPAALSDFACEKMEGKIQSGKGASIRLKPNKKLLKEARKRHPKLFIFGFKAEPFSGKGLEAEARKLMKEDSLQAVAANDIKINPIGSDRNELLLISAKRKEKISGNKEEIAGKLLDFLEKTLHGKV